MIHAVPGLAPRTTIVCMKAVLVGYRAIANAGRAKIIRAKRAKNIRAKGVGPPKGVGRPKRSRPARMGTSVSEPFSRSQLLLDSPEKSVRIDT